MNLSTFTLLSLLCISHLHPYVPCTMQLSGTNVIVSAPSIGAPIIVTVSNALHNWVDDWSRTNPAIMPLANPGPNHFYRVRLAP